MKHLAFGGVVRRISWTLVSAFMLQLLVLANPRPSQAQVTALPSVAILDFGSYPGVRVGNVQTRNATDAVWLEMNRAGGYDIAPRATVNEELNKLDLTGAPDRSSLQRIGQSLGVKYILSGDITDIRFLDAPRRAKATISLRLTDVASGEFVNGAIQAGLSPIPSAGTQPDDETLVSQAITAAAFSAVKTVREYTLPEATILTNRGNTEVRLNRGGRDGIAPGLEMIVVRGTEKVGRVRITSVQATSSEAQVLDAGKGIRPQDKAIAVFSLPGLVVSPSGEFQKVAVPDVDRFSIRKPKQKSLVQTVIGVAAAVALGAFITRTASSNNGAGIVGVNARAYAEYSIATSNDPLAARVELRWRAAPDVPQNNVIEYHIYRNEEIIGVTPRNQLTFVDSPSRVGQVTFNEISYAGGIFIPGATTTAGGTTNGGGANAGGNNAGGNNAGGNNAGGNNAGGGNGNDPSIPNSLRQITRDVAPLTVGVTHRYRVSVLYKQVVAADLSLGGGGGGGLGGGGGIGGGGLGGGGLGGGGGIGGGGLGGGGGIGGGGLGGGGGIGGGGIGGGGIGGGGNAGGGQNGTQLLYRESNVEAVSGPVTPIARPGITGPTTDQDLRRVVVTFRTVQGANEYCVEFSDSPNFKKKVQMAPFIAPFAAGLDSRTEAYNIFDAFPRASRIYFRVGARNAIDAPGPVGKDTPNADSFVYSQDGSVFGRLPLPPGPPSTP
ncbi:MAG: hypothetical protein ACKO5K_02935 [Armatimonadota bacterium]